MSTFPLLNIPYHYYLVAIAFCSAAVIAFIVLRGKCTAAIHGAIAIVNQTRGFEALRLWSLLLHWPFAVWCPW